MVDEDAPLPSGFIERRVLPGRHAVFIHCCHVSGLRPFVHAIFSERLPGFGYEAAGDPLFTEVYGEDFDPVRFEGVIEVCVPLKDQ